MSFPGSGENPEGSAPLYWKEECIVPLKLNVGVSRKVGLPDYGSIGASCNIELELDGGLLERDLNGFHARVRDAFVAARQAVHDELARVQAPIELPQPTPGPAPPSRMPTAGRGNGNGHSPHVPAERSRTRKPATEKQVKAILSIARQQHADLDGLLQQEFGVERPEDLSIKQASELIDMLKTASRI
jgi:hypothetical protein